MRKIERLRLSALESCRLRGHDMSRFAIIGRYKTAYCKRCDLAVAITDHPLPNDVEIGGGAVALNCP